MINSANGMASSAQAPSSSANAPPPGLKTYFKTPEGRYKLQHEKGHPFGLMHCVQGKTVTQIVVASAIGAKFGVDGNPGELPKWYAGIVAASICTYVAGFAWSWGPLGWLVPSKIFPLEIRSAAQSVSVSVNMASTFMVAGVFLNMLRHLKFGPFLFFFAFCVAVMSIFVYFLLPETKGIPIEGMGTVWKKHWYLSRFVSNDDVPIRDIEWLQVGMTQRFIWARFPDIGKPNLYE